MCTAVLLSSEILSKFFVCLFLKISEVLTWEFSCSVMGQSVCRSEYVCVTVCAFAVNEGGRPADLSEDSLFLCGIGKWSRN